MNERNESISPEDIVNSPESSAEKLETEHFDVAAVLGAGFRSVENGQAKLTIDSRLRAIAAGIIASEGKASELIFSGGKTSGQEYPSEAEAMRDYLLVRFPELRDFPITLDEESIDTSQNAEFTSKVMKDKGLESALLITNEYHMLRSSRNFERKKVDVEPLPAEEVIEGADPKYHLYKNFVDKYLNSYDIKKKKAVEVVLRGIMAIDPDGKLLTALAKKMRHGEEE